MKIPAVLVAFVFALVAGPAVAQPTGPNPPGLTNGSFSPSLAGNGGPSMLMSAQDRSSRGNDRLSAGPSGSGQNNGQSGGDGGAAAALPGLEEQSAGSNQEEESPLDEFLTVEQEDDRLILGVRMDGRERFSEIHEDFVPFLTLDAELWPEGIYALFYGEESDDWMRLEVLASQERSFIDIEGRGDDRIDTETERDLFGFWN